MYKKKLFTSLFHLCYWRIQSYSQMVVHVRNEWAQCYFALLYYLNACETFNDKNVDFLSEDQILIKGDIFKWKSYISRAHAIIWQT